MTPDPRTDRDPAPDVREKIEALRKSPWDQPVHQSGLYNLALDDVLAILDAARTEPETRCEWTDDGKHEIEPPNGADPGKCRHCGIALTQETP